MKRLVLAFMRILFSGVAKQTSAGDGNIDGLVWLDGIVAGFWDYPRDVLLRVWLNGSLLFHKSY